MVDTQQVSSIELAKHVIILYLTTGFVWVLENLESLGILLWYFPGLESP